MGTYTYSLPDDLVEDFKDEVPEGSRSGKIEEWMKEFLDRDKSERSVKKPVMSFTGLTSSRRRMAELVLEDGSGEIGKAEFFKSTVRRKGVYTKKAYYKDAVKVLTNLDGFPYREEGTKLVAESVDCVCGASVPYNVLKSNGLKCPKKSCNQEYEI